MITSFASLISLTSFTRDEFYIIKINKMVKKRKKVIDDTCLEWYGLTPEDIERIKKDEDEIGDIDIDTLYLATKIQEFLYISGKEVSLDDILKFLKNSVKDNEKIGYYSIT